LPVPEDNLMNRLFPAHADAPGVRAGGDGSGYPEPGPPADPEGAGPIAEAGPPPPTLPPTTPAAEEKSVEAALAVADAPAEAAPVAEEKPAEAVWGGTTPTRGTPPDWPWHEGGESPVGEAPAAEEKPAEAAAAAEEKPAEAPPVAEEKPAEAALVEATPAVEEKSVEAASVAEEKSVEAAFTAEEKPAEVAVGAEEKPAEAPAAAVEKPAEAAPAAEEKPAEAAAAAEEKPAEASPAAEEKPAEEGSADEADAPPSDDGAASQSLTALKEDLSDNLAALTALPLHAQRTLHDLRRLLRPGAAHNHKKPPGSTSFRAEASDERDHVWEVWCVLEKRSNARLHLTMHVQDRGGRPIPTQCGSLIICGTTGDEANYYPGNAAAHIHAFLEVLRAIGRAPDTTPNTIDTVRALVLMAKEWRPLDSQWLSPAADAGAALPSVADGASAELTEKQAAEADAAKNQAKNRPAGVMKKPAGAKPEPSAAGEKELDKEEEGEAEEEHEPPRDSERGTQGEGKDEGEEAEAPLL
jgi:hypothetical protein